MPLLFETTLLKTQLGHVLTGEWKGGLRHCVQQHAHTRVTQMARTCLPPNLPCLREFEGASCLYHAHVDQALPSSVVYMST